jgi:hypothetical protein
MLRYFGFIKSNAYENMFTEYDVDKKDYKACLILGPLFLKVIHVTSAHISLARPYLNVRGRN